jgi:hypothetical protein
VQAETEARLSRFLVLETARASRNSKTTADKTTGSGITTRAKRKIKHPNFDYRLPHSKHYYYLQGREQHS